MTPHLVKWQEKYGDQGFQVIEVQYGVSNSLEAIKQHTEELQLPFPVLYDTDGKSCGRFGASQFPHAFLVGRDGNILWQGIPSGSDEGKIAAALQAK